MSYILMQRFEINRVQRSDKTTMKCGLQLLIEEASIVYICMRRTIKTRRHIQILIPSKNKNQF